MLTELDGGDALIALSFSGRLGKEDVERAMRRLETAFEHGGPVHLFIEVKGFRGMSLEASASDLTHGLRFLGRLIGCGITAVLPWARGVSGLQLRSSNMPASMAVARSMDGEQT